MSGYILDGVYYRDGGEPEAYQVASMDKAHSHDAQRREHRRDLIQPYVNGKPNPAFIEQWPEESKNYGFVGGNNGQN